MVRRALLAFLLALAWAVPAHAFNVARVDSFQQGLWPDSSFAGCEDAKITSTSSVGDTLNYGSMTAAPAIQCGGTGTTKSRTLFRWTFGSYLPSTAIIDSMKLRLNVVIADGDSILGAIVLENWVEGTGDGTFSASADTTGACWKSWSYNTGAGFGDSTWTLRGADSAFVGVPKTGTARFTVTGIQDQMLAGTAVYSSTTAATASDREGAWHYCGAITATGEKTLDVSWARFIYNDLRATANNGFILKAVNGEGLSGNHRSNFSSSELASTFELRPKLVVYWHDVNQPTTMGRGDRGIWR